MFSNIGFGEILMVAVLGLVIFGPERLPRAAADAVRMFKQVRAMADSALADVRAELPPDLADLDLRSLDPRHLVQRAIFDGRDPRAEEDDDRDRDRRAERAALRSLDDDVPEGQTTLLDDEGRMPRAPRTAGNQTASHP